MPSHFDFNADAHGQARTQARPTGSSRRLALLGGVVLVAAALVMMYVHIGFARFALTGPLWHHADGTVIDQARTSSPTIQFIADDGFAHFFKEDYVLLCAGRSSLCFIRDFDPGQVVPVVYDPAEPQRAYVYDWALFAGVITWVLEAGAGAFFVLMIALALRRKPLNLSFTAGTSSPAHQSPDQTPED